MKRKRTIVILLALILLSATTALAQDKTTGSIKGKVRVEGRGAASDVTVSVRQQETEVAHTLTNNKGEFIIRGLQPGTYTLTFRKPGLSLGTLADVEVKAGKTNSLPDHLVLTINEASIARLAGSVFDEGGYSVPGVSVEIARLHPDGTQKKIDGRYTSESGQFNFRLSPDKATYRVTVKPQGAAPQSKDIEIDGAMVYRIAFTITRSPK
jgi:protocatechuate 3,4-dioxygenase beta subunit